MATPFQSRPNDRPLLYNAKYECDKCGHKWKLRRTSGENKSCPNYNVANGACSNYRPVAPYKKIPIDKLVVYKCMSCETEKKETRCAKEVDQLPYCRVCNCDMERISCKIIKRFLNKKRLKRQFGEFKCHKCGRSWKSGNSWEGKGQKCKRCNVMVHPFNLQPLRPPDSSRESKEPHDQERCEMCQELGRNCQNVNNLDLNTADEVADESELPDEEDLRSVLTDTSSIITRDETFSPLPDVSSGEVTPTENDDIIEEDVIAETTRRLAELKVFYNK